MHSVIIRDDDVVGGKPFGPRYSDDVARQRQRAFASALTAMRPEVIGIETEVSGYNWLVRIFFYGITEDEMRKKVVAVLESLPC